MYACYLQINIYLLTYLLTYLLQGGRSIQSLHAWDFEPLHRVRGRSSTGSKASGPGDKMPEAGGYFFNKYEIPSEAFL